MGDVGDNGVLIGTATDPNRDDVTTIWTTDCVEGTLNKIPGPDTATLSFFDGAESNICHVTLTASDGVASANDTAVVSPDIIVHFII